MSDEDIQAYFETNYSGLSRVALHKVDPGLLSIMHKRGILDIIPVLRKKARKWGSMSDDDVIQFYNDNYGGKPRGWIKKNDYSLHENLSRRGLMEHIPTISKTGRMNWTIISDDEVMEIYRETCEGLSRRELELANNKLYHTMHSRGLLHTIPRKMRDWKSTSDEEMVKYYKEHYPGLTRTELETADISLCTQMRNRGLIHNVPKKIRYWSKMTDDEVIEYYKEHYDGLGRDEIGRKDCKFAEEMRKRGLMKMIPRADGKREERAWKEMSDNELVRYYKDNYGGMPRGKLRRVDGGLANIMHMRDLMNNVPAVHSERINTTEKLTKLLDTENKAKYAIQLAHGDEIDFADIMVVLYEGRITRQDVLRFVEDPSVRDYLGSFQKPSGISGIIDPAEEILPLDRNGVLRDIIYKRLLQYRQEYLGTNPSPEQKITFLDDMRSEMGRLGGDVA